ncbi:DUF481 domain-containing protein [Echinimonas agarilytica]|uniref:DUF481 domain-containing protein n=1 Tax=Echinimonas agarilytica TaxID=1215918 RepID=A0AA41W5H9_9GAMM|nr:DUF481 domain-containing protein [Echinimonas agarilytica]MCM2678902.1 DUF481 domain-containing protein [Echinimonas agarilytica]
MRKLISLSVAMVLSGPAQALDISDDDLKEKGLAAEVEGGLTLSTGNSETTNLRGRLAVDYFLEDWRHYTLVEGNSSQDDDKTSAERYFAGYKVDRDWSDVNYTYAGLSYENDRFNGFEDLVTVSAGYGHRFKFGDNMNLDTEIGPGYRWNNAGEGTDEWILRGSMKYLWEISDNSKFTENVSVNAGDENTISRSETSLTTTIIGELALKLSFTMTHQTNPEFNGDGTRKDKLDTTTAVTLLYRY